MKYNLFNKFNTKCNFQKNKLLSKYEENIIDPWQFFSQNTISQGFVLNFHF